jgi:ribonuclease HII
MLEKYLKPYQSEIQIGVDEAGRGCLFGPVFVGAVIWNNDINDKLLELIKDSKKLSKKNRAIVREFIENNALAYNVSYCDNTVIDDINILQATHKAMHKCLDNIYGNNIKFDRILVDGNSFKPYIRNNYAIEHNCIVSGDNKYIQIAAASILAKTYRDEYIENLCKEDDNLKKYGLMTNYGYGTKEHREAIKLYGYTKYHRKTFKLKELQ